MVRIIWKRLSVAVALLIVVLLADKPGQVLADKLGRMLARWGLALLVCGIVIVVVFGAMSWMLS